MEKVINLINLIFKIYRKTIFYWSVIIFGIMFLYMVLFPYVRDIAEVKFDLMPTEFLELFGMSSISSMGNYNSYFEVIYGIVIIAVSFFSISFSNNLIADEEEKGTICFLINQNVTRKNIYTSKFILAIVSSLFISLLAVFSGVICGLLAGSTFIFSEVVLIGLTSLIIPMIFTSFSFLVNGLSFKKKNLSIVIFFVIYMIGYLGTLIDSVFLKNVSPFNTLKYGADSVLVFTVFYILIIIIFSLLGLEFYKKRDLEV